MIFHRLGLLNKDQRGFTLVGWLMAIAVAGVISGGITMTIFQVFDQNARSTAHMTAVKQVEHAVHWISRDAQMAQTVEATDPDGFPLTLTWTDWDVNNSEYENTVTYNLTGSGSKQLERQHLACDVLGSETKNVTTRVASYINSDSDKTNCAFADGVLTFEITATVGYGSSRESSETRVCEVIPRPDM